LKKLFLIFTFLFGLFYRPAGGKAWSLFAAYDTRRQAIEETKNFGEGGTYEFKIVPLIDWL
jgi:hypothetical protein